MAVIAERRARRGRRKGTPQKGNEAVPKKTRGEEVVKAPVKPLVFQRSGWCAEAHLHKDVAGAHARCPNGDPKEGPESFLQCPCPCHLPGVLEAIRLGLTGNTVVEGECECGLQGRKVKSKTGRLLWKCPEGHRWPRTTA